MRGYSSNLPILFVWKQHSKAIRKFISLFPTEIPMDWILCTLLLWKKMRSGILVLFESLIYYLFPCLLSVLYFTVGVHERSPSKSERLHFRSHQFHTGLKTVQQMVLEPRLFVSYYDLHVTPSTRLCEIDCITSVGINKKGSLEIPPVFVQLRKLCQAYFNPCVCLVP